MNAHRFSPGEQLVIFGISNILSDLFDAALAHGLPVKAVVVDQPETPGERDLSTQSRLDAYGQLARRPQLIALADFSPAPGDLYLLGPTTPQREHLASRLVALFGLHFCTLVHPRAYVSPLACLGPGVFVGANSTVAAGVHLAEHVFVNRGVTVGHETHVGPFTRIQPGANVGGLSVLGKGVTVGLGATVLERLRVGDGALVGAGTVVTKDVPERVLVFGVPAKIIKHLR